MTGHFGQGLLQRAAAIARQGVERAGAAMVAAAEAELPPGIWLEREGEDVVLAGPRLRNRYWGSARRAADAALRLLVSRMSARGPR